MNGHNLYFSWEPGFMAWLQGVLGSTGSRIISFFSFFGEEMIMILIFGLLYWCLDKKGAKLIGTSLMLGLTINPMLKNAVLRRRPYFDHPEIKCIRPVNAKADLYDISAQGFSFPSGHSLNSAVMYGSLAYIWNLPVVRACAVILPFIVGLSRITAGVHYPTDVLTGWIIGTLITVLVPRFLKRIKNRGLWSLILFAVSLTGVLYCRTNDYFTGLGMMAGYLIAVPFEEKYVSFPETNHPVTCILRLAGGLILFLIVNTLLKLPFSAAFLESGTMVSYLVRSVRYAVIIFVMLGLYPMVFGRIRPEKQGSAA